MPTYIYQCQKYDYIFEARQKFNDPPILRCPRCEGKVKRITQPTNFFFKEKESE